MVTPLDGKMGEEMESRDILHKDWQTLVTSKIWETKDNIQDIKH